MGMCELRNLRSVCREDVINDGKERFVMAGYERKRLEYTLVGLHEKPGCLCTSDAS